MSDLVSRQTVLDILEKEGHKWGNDYRDWVDAIEEIKKLQPVDPIKTGYWIFVDKTHEHAHCSECDYGNVDLLDGRPHNYCPNCGCRMIDPQERSE